MSKYLVVIVALSTILTIMASSLSNWPRFVGISSDQGLALVIGTELILLVALIFVVKAHRA